VIDYLWQTKKEGAKAFAAPMDLSKRDVQLALDDYRDLIVMYEKGLFPRSGAARGFVAPQTAPDMPSASWGVLRSWTAEGEAR